MLEIAENQEWDENDGGENLGQEDLGDVEDEDVDDSIDEEEGVNMINEMHENMEIMSD